MVTLDQRLSQPRLDDFGGDRGAPRSAAARWWASLALVVAGVVLSLAAAAASYPLTAPAQWGFLKAISPAWYVGLVLVAIGFVLSRTCASWCTGAAGAGLVVVLSGSQTIAYPLPRYSWVFKNVGISDYMQQHGHLPPNTGSALDIYHAWPGFFAASAELSKLMGLHDPTTIARWWPPLIDLACLFAMKALAAKLLRGSTFLPWFVAVAVFLANNIGDDPHYFAPQSVAYLFALVIFAVAITRDDESMHAIQARIAIIALLSVASMWTHQITPFLISAGLVVLVLFRLVRPWWTPLVTLVPALAWSLAHFSDVRHGLPASQIGDIFGNLHVARTTTSGVAVSTTGLLQANFAAIAGGVILLGVLAIVALVVHRDRLSLALCVAAASAASLIVVTNYGSEGSFRVSLFALPWLVIAAARLRVPAGLRAITLAVGLAVLCGLNLVGEHGLDWYVTVKPADLALEQTFETVAPPDSVIVTVGYGPFVQDATARYPDFSNLEFDNIVNVPQPGKAINPVSPTASVAYLSTYVGQKYPRPAYQTYAVVSDTLAAQGIAYGQYTQAQYTAVEQALARSPQWTLVAKTSSGALYRKV